MASPAPTQLIPIDIPSGIKDRKGQMKWGLAKSGQVFACKQGRWNETSLPFRLAHEFIYYVVASRSGLQMPAGEVVDIKGVTYWGNEYLPGRTSLTDEGCELEGKQLAQFSQLFRESVNLREGYLRAILLDIAMVNGDRPPWNILFSEPRGKPELWYYDHDRSLGWRGNGEPAFIGSPEMEAARLNIYLGKDYLTCPALAASSREELMRIFRALDLNIDYIHNLRADFPPEWMTYGEFTALREGIRVWWEYLARNFDKDLCDRVLAFGK